MGFIEATRSGYAGVFSFGGRATRPEYWWFFLAQMTVFPLAVALLFLLASALHPVLLVVPAVLMLWTVLANVALTFRRLRDAGGWIGWYLGAILLAIASLTLTGFELATLIQSGQLTTLSDAEIQAYFESASTTGISSLLSIASLIGSLVTFVYMFVPSRG